MSFDFSTVQNAASTAWNWSATQASAIGASIQALGANTLQQLTPIAAFLADKIQNAWSLVQPYFGVVADFIRSNLGIATMLLGCTILCMTLSQKTDNLGFSIALQAAGVISAVAAGALLVGASVLAPNLPIMAFGGF